MDRHSHYRDYAKLALAHLCVAIAEALLSGWLAALPTLLLGGAYAHTAYRWYRASCGETGRPNRSPAGSSAPGPGSRTIRCRTKPSIAACSSRPEGC